MTPWLHVIGIGEDGWDGLSGPARAALEAAEVIVGGNRHHALAPALEARRMHWPNPFRHLAKELHAMAGQRVAVLVTGDPLWFSAGAYIGREFGDQAVFHPQISAFQWAAARMRWSLADVDTLTIHGRPAEQAIPAFAPGARLLILTQDATSPATVAQLLAERGYGLSPMTVLGALGGPNESRVDGIAAKWGGRPAPDFHVLAVECRTDPDGPPPLPLTGLPDDAFAHDGQLTKREIRAMTVAALAPRRGTILWDIGAGCGSVGVEYMRAARDAQAIAIEPDEARRSMIATNAARLGAPRLKVVAGRAPDALDGLPAPQAVLVGGGLGEDTATRALEALTPGGRLVANAVTLQSEGLLATLHARHGGELCRIAVARAEPVGNRTGWRPMMPVTQWVFQK